MNEWVNIQIIFLKIHPKHKFTQMLKFAFNLFSTYFYMSKCYETIVKAF
jgi:hypothetical protein